VFYFCEESPSTVVIYYQNYYPPYECNSRYTGTSKVYSTSLNFLLKKGVNKDQVLDFLKVITVASEKVLPKVVVNWSVIFIGNPRLHLLRGDYRGFYEQSSIKFIVHNSG